MYITANINNNKLFNSFKSIIVDALIEDVAISISTKPQKS